MASAQGEIKVSLDTEQLRMLLDKIADQERRIAALEAKQAPDIDYGAAFNSAEECRAHTCGYFTGYLAYGPPELTHEGYHAAEKAFDQHADSCKHDWSRSNCPTHASWEKRLRA